LLRLFATLFALASFSFVATLSLSFFALLIDADADAAYFLGLR